LKYSTPNIAKVKKEIRQVSEWAYRHRDISGLLPWYKNKWIEHQHDSESSGKSATHCVGSPTEYKADTRIFKCYASTATGEHVKSKAGRSILQDRKILGLIVLVLACFAVSFHFYTKRFGDKKSVVPAAEVYKTPVVAPTIDGHHSADVVVPVTRPIDQRDNVEVLKNLDRTHALKWSINGIGLDELPGVPANCTVMSSAVKCKVFYEASLIAVSLNHVCYPYFKTTLCHIVFFVNRPKPATKDDKKTVLAKSLPF